ncbi:unnamed protein product [Arctogadus glacialis]
MVTVLKLSLPLTDPNPRMFARRPVEDFTSSGRGVQHLELRSSPPPAEGLDSSNFGREWRHWVYVSLFFTDDSSDGGRGQKDEARRGRPGGGGGGQDDEASSAAERRGNRETNERRDWSRRVETPPRKQSAPPPLATREAGTDAAGLLTDSQLQAGGTPLPSPPRLPLWYPAMLPPPPPTNTTTGPHGSLPLRAPYPLQAEQRPLVAAGRTAPLGHSCTTGDALELLLPRKLSFSLSRSESSERNAELELNSFISDCRSSLQTGCSPTTSSLLCRARRNHRARVHSLTPPSVDRCRQPSHLTSCATPPDLLLRLP